jgi:hypothetical protein
MSLAVLLVLGFVLTSQITDRVLEVKVRAATEEMDRARTTVGGIVGGEEARSLDSSLQLARNTLTSKTGPSSGAGLAARSTRCWWSPATARGLPPPSGRSIKSLRRCAISSRPARSATSTRGAHRRLRRARADHRHPASARGPTWSST